ncbi:MAG: hypothetical protein ACJ72M_06925 [Propionibacteriaceae bacterium]|jgi:hypothetical protein
MFAPRKYDQEFRERAVRMYRERLAEPGESKRGAPPSCRSVAGPEPGDAAELGRGAGPGRVRTQPGAQVGGVGGGSGIAAAGGGAGAGE